MATPTPSSRRAQARHSPTSPPYVPYGQFEEALRRLARNPPSGPLDLAEFHRSQQTRRRVGQALRFFGLVTEDLHPTLELHRLLKLEAIERRKALGELIMSHYPWLGEIKPGSPYSALMAALERHTDLRGQTVHRAARFLTSASKTLGIDLPVQSAPRGRPRSRNTVSGPIAASVPDETASERRKGRYFDFLLGAAKRSEIRGELDRDILDRLDVLLAIDQGESSQIHLKVADRGEAYGQRRARPTAKYLRLDPAVAAWIERLPDKDQPWPVRSRQQWLSALAAILENVNPEPK